MLKRDGILFIRGLIPALIITALLGAACIAAGLSASKGASDLSEPVKVALVDEEDTMLSRISTNMVAEQDYVSSLMEFEETDTEGAMEGLEDGTYGAAVILPDGFVEGIMHGREMSGKIYISDSLQSEEDLINAVADFGGRLLSAGQYGVFAGEKIISEKGLSPELHTEFLNEANSKLISFALESYGYVFTFEELPYSNTGLSLKDHYITSWLAFLIIVCGLFFPDLYTGDCKGSIFGRLKSLHISNFDFMFGKIIFPCIFRCMIIIPAGLFLKIPDIWLLTAACLFASVITSLLAVSLSKKGGWVVSTLALSSICLFLVGGMLPRNMLPDAFPVIAGYMPYGVVLDLIKAAILGSDTIGIRTVITGTVYTVLLLISAMMFLRDLPKGNEEVRL